MSRSLPRFSELSRIAQTASLSASHVVGWVVDSFRSTSPTSPWSHAGRRGSKDEHRFLLVNRDFGFTNSGYRGLAKYANHLHILFAAAN